MVALGRGHLSGHHCLKSISRSKNPRRFAASPGPKAGFREPLPNTSSFSKQTEMCFASSDRQPRPLFGQRTSGPASRPPRRIQRILQAWITPMCAFLNVKEQRAAISGKSPLEMPFNCGSPAAHVGKRLALSVLFSRNAMTEYAEPSCCFRCGHAFRVATRHVHGHTIVRREIHAFQAAFLSSPVRLFEASKYASGFTACQDQLFFEKLRACPCSCGDIGPGSAGSGKLR